MAANCKGRNCGMSKWDDIKELSPVAYDFLTSFNPGLYTDGRYELDEGIYVNIESYKTRRRQECKFEAHKKYVDIQYMISGKELITVAPLDKLTCIEQYNIEKDVSFYQNCPVGIDYLLTENDFLVFMPSDAHMPCIALNQMQKVRKAVVKIPIR